MTEEERRQRLSQYFGLPKYAQQPENMGPEETPALQAAPDDDPYARAGLSRYRDAVSASAEEPQSAHAQLRDYIAARAARQGADEAALAKTTAEEMDAAKQTDKALGYSEGLTAAGMLMLGKDQLASQMMARSRENPETDAAAMRAQQMRTYLLQKHGKEAADAQELRGALHSDYLSRQNAAESARAALRGALELNQQGEQSRRAAAQLEQQGRLAEQRTQLEAQKDAQDYKLRKEALGVQWTNAKTEREKLAVESELKKLELQQRQVDAATKAKADGNKWAMPEITGWELKPGVQLGDAAKEKVRELDAEMKAFRAGVGELLDAARGGRAIGTERAKRAEALHRDLQLQAKGTLYNLGVLAGPDLKLLDEVLPNPVAPKPFSSLSTAASDKAKLDAVLGRMEQKYRAKMESHGFKPVQSTDGQTASVTIVGPDGTRKTLPADKARAAVERLPGWKIEGAP